MKYSADELVRILLDKQRHNGLVSQQQPLRIQESKVFLVDTSELGDPEDIKADDLGSWKNDGQHSRWAKVKQVNGSVRLVEFCSGKPRNDPSSYCLHRHYYVHHSNNHQTEDCPAIRYDRVTSGYSLCNQPIASMV